MVERHRRLAGFRLVVFDMLRGMINHQAVVEVYLNDQEGEPTTYLVGADPDGTFVVVKNFERDNEVTVGEGLSSFVAAFALVGADTEANA